MIRDAKQKTLDEIAAIMSYCNPQSVKAEARRRRHQLTTRYILSSPRVFVRYFHLVLVAKVIGSLIHII